VVLIPPEYNEQQGFDIMKTELEEKLNNQRTDWVLKHFHCKGLEPHNRSIEWVIETVQDLGATIDIGGENRGHRIEHSFAIRLRGTSGVLYRISVHYRPRFTNLISERFSEVNFVEEGDLDILLQPFRYMMNYEIHWLDDRDGAWENLCIHGHRDRPITSWPGDELVTTLVTLADDLRHAVFDKKMNTLRSELRKSYMISWCGGYTPSDVTFEDVSKYIRHISEMEDTRNKEDFTEAHNAAMLELYGVKPIWTPEGLA
jgi:hypothetical protein